MPGHPTDSGLRFALDFSEPQRGSKIVHNISLEIGAI